MWKDQRFSYSDRDRTVPARAQSRLLVIAALLIGWLTLPSQATAECGDYVVRGSPAQTTLAVTSMAGHTVLPAASKPPNSQHRPLPCRGPFCSQRWPVPPTTPATVISVDCQQWALLSSRQGCP